MEIGQWEKKVTAAINKALGLRINRVYSEHDFFTFTYAGKKLSAKQLKLATDALRAKLDPAWDCSKFEFSVSMSSDSGGSSVYVAATFERHEEDTPDERQQIEKRSLQFVKKFGAKNSRIFSAASLAHKGFVTGSLCNAKEFMLSLTASGFTKTVSYKSGEPYATFKRADIPKAHIEILYDKYSDMGWFDIVQK